MSEIKLAVLGAGNLQYAIPVIASLATYFGERPLAIAFYDADEERLDLFDRFARLSFLMMETTHTLSSSTDFREALQDAQLVISQMDEYCARKQIGGRAAGLSTAEVELTAMLSLQEFVPPDAHLLGLSGAFVEWPQSISYTPNWPATLGSDDPYAVPMQILRWLNGEEYPYGVFREQEKSPLKQWLDNPMSLPVRTA
jgi:hypothetical protein